MERKRLTQRFPWLLPIRKKQKIACFYLLQRLDGRHYAVRRQQERFSHLLFETRCPMLNLKTGFPLVYQQNKMHNLSLAAAALDGLIIAPGETFSFWRLVKNADRDTPYRDGLVEVDGRLTVAPGGGLCQMSNLLFWVFLHTPMTVVERHGHAVKDFPEPPSDAPLGVDATVSEGWLDLKLHNGTDEPFQLFVALEGDMLIGRVYTARDTGVGYHVINGGTRYVRRGGHIYEETDVLRQTFTAGAALPVRTEKLYQNQCKIGYRLAEGTPVQEEA